MQDTQRQNSRTPKRVLVYCHDSMGIGHLRRSLAICERVAESHADTSFLLATGTPYCTLFDSKANIDCIKLPALAKRSDGTYGSKFLGLSVERLMRCRESLLLHTVESYEPDLVLVDKAPLGVCKELVPTLRWLSKHRSEIPIIFGMRDIEDAAETTIAEWRRDGVCQVLEECFAQIWVYGMRSVFDVVREYGLSDAISAKLSYQGYVTRDICTHPAMPKTDRGNVLVTVGGGTDGESLLDAFLQHAAGELHARGFCSTLVAGPDLPLRAQRRLQRQAETLAGVEWIDFAACMSCHIKQADLIVSMGGYNTLCEIARHGKPALVIPRSNPRMEQTIRADLWEKLGLLHAFEPSDLTPRFLTARIMTLLDDSHAVNTQALDMGGLDRVGQRFSEFLDKEPAHAPALPV